MKKNRMDHREQKERTTSRKGVVVLGVTVCIIIFGLLVGFALLLVSSPGEIAPFTDENGDVLPTSISEKTFIQVNGARQGMFIRGKDLSNPVLLFLHGGPGLPEVFLTDQYPTGLEERFTVVWWDQRGSGLSFDPDLDPETMTYEQFIADTVTVSQYLCDRFGKEKIYLMGHSGGSYFGIQAAARHPELFAAYIGIGQISDLLRSERLAYEYMLEQYTLQGNEKMVRKLTGAPVTESLPLPTVYLSLRDKAMHELGVGSTREMDSVVSGIFLPSLRYKGYTMLEKVNLWRGKILTRKLMWNALLENGLMEQALRLEIPVYFFHGAYDYTVSYPLAHELFKSIDAPIKGFYTFQDSAHSPIFEEPERVNQILIEDVLNNTVNLADPE